MKQATVHDLEPVKNRQGCLLMLCNTEQWNTAHMCYFGWACHTTAPHDCNSCTGSQTEAEGKSHRQVGKAANEVVHQVDELLLGDDLLGVQVQALEEILVPVPAAQLGLHFLKESQLFRHVGARKGALLLCGIDIAGTQSAVGGHRKGT